MVRAADFLGFGRCFIALLEDGQFRVRYKVARGESRARRYAFPEGIATRALRAKEVFWSDDLNQLEGVNLEVIAQYQAKQLLTVPLLGADGRVLGMFGVLDRLDETGISREDIRRARALAAQVSVVLEVAHNLHQSELNRRRSDVLMQLAREIDGLLRLPDFARKFVDRAAQLLAAQAGAFALLHGGRLQTVALYPQSPLHHRNPDRESEVQHYDQADHEPSPQDRSSHNHPDQNNLRSEMVASGSVVQAPDGGDDPLLQQRFARAASELPMQGSETIVSGAAARIARR